jgi:Tfp pilus assembly protein PilP
MRKDLFRNALLIMAIILIVVIIGNAANAQQPQPQNNGPSIDQISTEYKMPAKDPFRGEIKNSVKVEPIKPPEILPWPSYQEREEQWKIARDEARKKGLPAPAAAERYLLDELTVVGIYKKPDGQGLFLKPNQNNSTMIFAAVGQKLYNGEIRQINGNKIECDEKIRIGTDKFKIESRTLVFTEGKH